MRVGVCERRGESRRLMGLGLEMEKGRAQK